MHSLSQRPRCITWVGKRKNEHFSPSERWLQPYTKQILPMTSSCCVVSDNGRTPDSGNLAASRHVLRETCIPYCLTMDWTLVNVNRT